MTTFGREHRRLRLAKTDHTLRDFAKKLGVTPAYVSNVENGLEPPFSEALVKKSARLMRLSNHEERILFSLRHQNTERARVEKAAFELARRTKHLSEEELQKILNQARDLVAKGRKAGGGSHK